MSVRTHEIACLGIVILSASAVLPGSAVVLSPSLAAAAAPMAAPAKVATIPVPGMSCAGCASNITGALDDLDGVKKVSIDLKKQRAVVRFDPKRVDLEAIVAAIESVGFEPGKPVVRGA